MVTALLAAIALSDYRLQDVKLSGSDGRTYNLSRLTQGKPALIFYLRVHDDSPSGANTATARQVAHSKIEQPTGIRDLNRLAGATRGKLRIYGLTNASPKNLRRLRQSSGAQFTLLAGNWTSFTNQILLGYNHRDLAHLQNALVLPGRRLAAVWPGYSRASFAQVQRIVREETGLNLRLRLSKFPATRQAGSIEMFGLPGP